jgi:hypothetical protein
MGGGPSTARFQGAEPGTGIITACLEIVGEYLCDIIPVEAILGFVEMMVKLLPTCLAKAAS